MAECTTCTDFSASFMGVTIQSGSTVATCPTSEVYFTDNCGCVSANLNWCNILANGHILSENNSVKINSIVRTIATDPITGQPIVQGCNLNLEVNDNFFIQTQSGLTKVFCRDSVSTENRIVNYTSDGSIDITSVPRLGAPGCYDINFSSATTSVAKTFSVGCEGDLSSFQTVQRTGGTVILQSSNCNILELVASKSVPSLAANDTITFNFPNNPVTAIGRTNDPADADIVDRPVTADSDGYIKTNNTLKNAGTAGDPILGVDSRELCPTGFLLDFPCFTDKKDFCGFLGILESLALKVGIPIAGTASDIVFTPNVTVPTSTGGGRSNYGTGEIGITMGAAGGTGTINIVTQPTVAAPSCFQYIALLFFHANLVGVAGTAVSQAFFQINPRVNGSLSSGIGGVDAQVSDTMPTMNGVEVKGDLDATGIWYVASGATTDIKLQIGVGIPTSMLVNAWGAFTIGEISYSGILIPVKN